jgi:hypothetical protein
MTSDINDITVQELKDIVKAIPEEKFTDIFTDAWTIFSPEAFTKMGFPKEYVKHFETKQESDGTYKGNITVDGKVVDHVTGVISYDIAWNLAFRFGLEDAIDHSGGMMGRGFALRALSGPVWAYVQTDKKVTNRELNND